MKKITWICRIIKNSCRVKKFEKTLWLKLNIQKRIFLSGSNQLYKIILNPIPFWDLTQKSKQADTGTYYAAFKLYIQTHELMILGYRRIFLAQHSEFADDAIIYMNFPLSFSSSRVFFFQNHIYLYSNASCGWNKGEISKLWFSFSKKMTY